MKLYERVDKEPSQREPGTLTKEPTLLIKISKK